jgi:hypothetical protein
VQAGVQRLDLDDRERGARGVEPVGFVLCVDEGASCDRDRGLVGAGDDGDIEPVSVEVALDRSPAEAGAERVGHSRAFLR